jgi:hypothetical protein
MSRYVARMEKRTACWVLVGRSEGKRRIGGRGRRREDNISIHLRGMVWGGVELLFWFRIRSSGGLLQTR